MNGKELIRSALEALESCSGAPHWEALQPVVTALREAMASEAIEQPAQRTWVGLTDEEVDQGLLRSDYAFKTAEAWRAGVVFAMTKLKEKNA